MIDDLHLKKLPVVTAGTTRNLVNAAINTLHYTEYMYSSNAHPLDRHADGRLGDDVKMLSLWDQPRRERGL
jgi:hypothetical protein